MTGNRFEDRKQYFASRFSSLKPPLERLENPISLLRQLKRQDWAFFSIAFLGWTWDAFDFFTVSLTIPDLARTFNRSKADISWGITLVLMMRSVGSIAFGIAADRYGRKWPFIINMVLFIIFEMATGFCTSFEQFLGVRAIYGIAMGGLYGNAAATALEDCPEKARGIISGMLQQGYAFGYLLATVFARALVNTTPNEWRPLYWFGACPPVLLIIWRYFMPETKAYQARMQFPKSNSSFVAQAKRAIRDHWKLLIYMVLLMAGFNFMAHGSQDLYPTMLANQYQKNPDQVTATQVVANLGAMCGGTTVGYLSQSFGRRFTMIVCCLLGAALVYPYTFATDGLIAAAFFEQFCVQGAWGVVPIHLMELSPGNFRTFVVGTSYQLGNLISSASSTIEATLGERFPLEPLPNDTQRYNYGKVICIFMAAVYIYVILLVFLGPEKLGRRLEADDDSQNDSDYDYDYDEDMATTPRRTSGSQHEPSRTGKSGEIEEIRSMR